MFALLILTSVLAATPAPVKLASPALTGINMKPEELTFYTDHLAQQLGFHNLRVITSSEIQQLLGFERQKQLLGCAESSSSCQAELANALGVDGLVTGSIGRIGKTLQINLKILRADDGAPLAAYSARVISEELLLDKLTEAAELMAKSVHERTRKAPVSVPVEDPVKVVEAPAMEKPLTRVDESVAAAPTPEVEVSSSGGLRRFAWAPAAGGVVLAGVGAFFITQANGKVQEINQAPTREAAERAHGEGKSMASLGAVLIGTGVAALAAGAGMYLFGSSTQVAVIPSAEPSVAVSGTFDLSSLLP